MIKTLKLDKSLFWIFALLAAGLVFRLVISVLGFHLDIISQAGWGDWIYKNGSIGFYENNIWTYSWPNHPPLVSLLYGFELYLYVQLLEFFRYLSSYVVPHLAPGHMLWWFDFVKWFDSAQYPESYLHIGYLLTIKLIPILSDIVIGLILYLMAKQQNTKLAFLMSLVYLFSPFSWYISALWGQTDQLSFVFLLAAFILTKKKLLFLNPVLFAISCSLKPTALIFVPLFVWIYLKKRPSFISFVLGFASSLIIIALQLFAFTEGNILLFLKNTLIPKVFFRSEFRVSTNAFNFWRIIIGNGAFDHNRQFLLMPAQVWGYMAFFMINFFAFKISNKINKENILAAIFLVGAGGWLFLTNMLDRYFFAGVVSLLFLSIYRIEFLKYFLILSITYLLNLYYGWFFPESIFFLRDVLLWQEGLLTRVLALLNVLIFIKVLYILKPFPKKFKVRFKRD